MCGIAGLWTTVALVYVAGHAYTATNGCRSTHPDRDQPTQRAARPQRAMFGCSKTVYLDADIVHPHAPHTKQHYDCRKPWNGMTGTASEVSYIPHHVTHIHR